MSSMEPSKVVAHCIQVVEDRVWRVSDCLVLHIVSHVKSFNREVNKVSDLLLLRNLSISHRDEPASFRSAAFRLEALELDDQNLWKTIEL